MDHSLFGCLRNPHAPAQTLHPAFTQSSLALHGRTDHVSYPDLPGPSPPCSYTGEEASFGGLHARNHPSQQLPHHQQHQPGWHVQQMPSSSSTRHAACLPHPDTPATELCTSGGAAGQSMCTANTGLGNTEPVGAGCGSGDYGRQTMSPIEPERRNSKGKSDNTGKQGMFIQNSCTFFLKEKIKSNKMKITAAFLNCNNFHLNEINKYI